MIALSLLTLAPFGYALPTASEYEVELRFDGYLPVFGGMEQNAKVELGLSVRGNPAGGRFEATTSLGALKLSLVDQETGKFEPFTIGMEAIKPYFPDSKVTFTERGDILGTTAPKFDLPVSLPGLHTQHLPEITFLGLQFPAGGVEQGKPWTYSRKLGGFDAQYSAVLVGKDEWGTRFDLTLNQKYSTYEDGFRNQVLEKARAKARVLTHVTGKGTVWFSGPKGMILRSELTAEANSEVYNLGASNSTSKRSLRITFLMEQKKK